MKNLLLIFTLILSADALDAGEPSSDSWKIVNFWSKTCAPCRLEIPELNYLNEALAPFNVSVVGVNFDEDDRETTLGIAEQMDITFPTLTIPAVEALNLNAPAVLPTTYILAPDNTIMAKLIGAQDRQMILAKLKELGVGK